MMTRPATIALLLSLTAVRGLGAQEPSPVGPDDYGQWESLGSGTLSPDGAWLAVPISRVNEENELRIHRVSDDSVVVVAYGSRPSFSLDGHWISYAIGKSREERDRLEEADEDVRNDLGLLDLRSGAQRTLTGIERSAWGADGAYLAMARYPDEETRTLIVEEPATGTQVSFGSVAEWAWQDEGSLLAFTVHYDDGVGNGVRLYDASTGQLRALDSDSVEYSQLTWREDSSDLAVLRSFEDAGHEEAGHVLLVWRDLGGSSSRSELDPASTEEIGPDERIVDLRSLVWADDGDAVFFGVKEWTPKEPEEEASSEDAAQEHDDTPKLDPPDMEIWRSSDVRTLPTQKRDERADEQRNDLFVWHLNSGQAVRLSDEDLDSPRVVAGGALVIATNDDAYEFDGMFGRGRVDLIAIDVGTGVRTTVVEGVTFPFGASPSGRFVHYYQDGSFFAFDVQSKAAVPLSGEVTFANEQYDHPVQEMPSYGLAGWTENDEALVVYDEFDVWELPIDGSPRRLTQGRQDEVIFRVVRLDPDADAIDLGDTYLTMRGKWTLHYGIARLRANGVERLVYEDRNIGRLAKASDADVYAYVAQDFDDSPDYFVGRSFRDAGQVTATNPFQNEYAWGHTELVRYTNHNDVPLQGALFYPADYDPSRTYPMIVYVYEFRSQSAKQYSVPSHRSYYNPAVWTAEGYFVLQPDILFDARDPGVSSAKTLERAVAAVLETGRVDPERVGLVGHSWGGYQAQFVPTYTDVFAASVAGAGISNLVTMYGSIFWVAGAPESGHFETGQERMDVPYYVDQEAYIRNSAVFNIESLETPLLLEVGDSDRNVNWGQSIELYNIARRAEKPLTMLVYHGEDHGLRQEKNQADYQRRIIEWFDHYLKGLDPVDWIEEQIPWLEQKKMGEGGAG